MDKLDNLYMDIALLISKKSYSKRNQVGALIVKGDNIMSFGWNGTPSKFDNICEDESGTTKPEVLHAELNAIAKLAKNGYSSSGATLYVTLSPCIECAKLIIQSGIKKVIYMDEYRLPDGISLLLKANIEVYKYEYSII